MSWIEKFKNKWGIHDKKQFLIIMLVFALTGTTVVFIKKPLIAFLFAEGVRPLWFQIAYWIFILPFYNVLLLCYGFLLGQFEFFWNYEKKMLKRFSRKKNVESK